MKKRVVIAALALAQMTTAHADTYLKNCYSIYDIKVCQVCQSEKCSPTIIVGSKSCTFMTDGVKVCSTPN